MEKDRQSVLIVDDESLSLEIAGNALSGLYDVLTAESGIEALEKIREQPVDLILLDIVMPGMGGFEICRRLKASKTAGEIPIIFMTAQTAIEDILKGFVMGAVDYVTKPFKTTELLARVKTHMDLAKARESERQLIADLQDALAKVKQLSGLLPMCSNCKKIRDDEGYWHQVERYLASYSDALISQAVCPECAKKIYP